MKCRSPVAFTAFLVFCLFTVNAFAQSLEPVSLPQPQVEGGKPLMQALKERKSSRAFSEKKLPLQVLSNLLWAADGINRPAEGKRTAPSALNLQPIDIYVAMAQGLYLYDAKGHRLEPVLAKDIRAFTGTQPFVKKAAVNLVYVADLAKMGDDPDMNDFYAAVNTGFISQNVYLYCASEGLSTVVRRYINVPVLAKEMSLRSDQKIVLSQSVGYPEE
jgi:nitroreductase